jgi:hypothetical protein
MNVSQKVKFTKHKVKGLFIATPDMENAWQLYPHPTAF